MSDAGKNVVSGSFVGTGVSTSIPVFGFATLLIEGGAGDVEVQRSTDGGANFFTVSQDELGAPAVYTPASDVAFNGRLYESESQVLYQLNCTAHVSGTINYRLAN